jgi:2-dehydro-3-deoxygalactonokinase
VSAGLTAGLDEPEALTSLLFRTRAAALLSARGADWCSGYLSGLLVGAEVAGHRSWLTGASVPLIGSPRFGRLYGAALTRIGIASEAVDATDATLSGLIEARSQSA